MTATKQSTKLKMFIKEMNKMFDYVTIEIISHKSYIKNTGVTIKESDEYYLIRNEDDVMQAFYRVLNRGGGWPCSHLVFCLEESESKELNSLTEEIKQMEKITVHEDIYAITFRITELYSLTYKELEWVNRELSKIFKNAYYYFTKCDKKLWFKLGLDPLIELNEDEITLTIQGRSWEDTCLKIINLNQNYRWESNLPKITYLNLDGLQDLQYIRKLKITA